MNVNKIYILATLMLCALTTWGALLASAVMDFREMEETAQVCCVSFSIWVSMQATCLYGAIATGS